MSVLTQAIYDVLADDTTLTDMLATYNGEPAIFTTSPAPGDAAMPYIVTAGDVAQEPADTKTTRGRTVTRDVKCFTDADGSAALVEAIAERVRALLHRQIITVNGYTVIIAGCSGPMEADEQDCYCRIVTVRMRIDEAPAPWWTGPWLGYDPSIPAIDASNVLIAYQPKAATGTIYERAVASYAASLVNLANPGTYNAVASVAPIWSAGTGWTGTGTQWLDTTLVPANTQNRSMFGAYDDATVDCELCGTYLAGPLRLVGIYPRQSSTLVMFGNQSASIGAVGALNAGVAGFAGTQAYLNGASFLTIGPSLGAVTHSLNLLRTNGPVAFPPTSSTIHAFVWYSMTITDAQARAVSWAMRVINDA